MATEVEVSNSIVNEVKALLEDFGWERSVETPTYERWVKYNEEGKTKFVWLYGDVDRNLIMMLEESFDV